MDVMYVANDLTLAGIEKSTISHIWRSKHEHLFVMLHLIETFICYATFDRTIWLLSYIWLKKLVEPQLINHSFVELHLIETFILLSYIWLKLLFCWATFDWNFILLSYIWLKHLFCWNFYFVELHLIEIFILLGYIWLIANSYIFKAYFYYATYYSYKSCNELINIVELFYKGTSIREKKFFYEKV